MSYSMLAVVGSFTYPSTSAPNPKLCNATLRRKEFISLLKNCKDANQILPIHAKIIRTGHDQDPFVLFQLLCLSSTLSSVNYASTIFQQVRNPNVFLYTALIDGFVLVGSYSDGIRLYYQMIDRFIVPDKYVITSVLKACEYRFALREGKEVHCQALKLGLCSNRSITMKLMEFYGKCGEFDNARKVFDKLTERDVVASTIMINCFLDHGLVKQAVQVFDRVRVKDTVCWTAMIDGLIRNGEMNMALELFREMQKDNVKPNEVTVVCVLSACSQLGALELGRWVHSYIGKHHRIELNHFVGGALINMYSRCGDIDEAERVFAMMKERNVITYNLMISGLAMHGKSIEAVDIFRGMIKQGILPTSVTFVAVLNACNHGGLVDLGFEMFHSMSKDYGIPPQIEHYGCIVDLLGRVGRLKEAYNFIQNMEIAPDHVMLVALLSACKIHGNLELGEQVARILINHGGVDSGTYVLLSNVYASSGKWKEAAQIRAKMKEGGILKEPGCSSIEVNNEIHEFLLGELRHPQKGKIYKKLEELNQILKAGHTPATDVVLHDIEDWEKEQALAIHSERLAICYGLISTKPGTTIRVVKNLRVCDDCHSMIKLLAMITGRKIVVRDRKRFHHFENGKCSCGDYW
ncbi:putative pentatricopeptide repeat-containing protein [Hibiscus syriacus]|uniref:Pentatricopeptide repeat-containing protein n=1 Tax=Hibiscus syriacus TaxID=106335 RepID=A0A6A2ZK65_HIBSY|nr:putative pentatricopeptide repeat-containing protein At5g59200, chloroplastic [Hibiscus syriacus]KAE8692113.1 putative pentatricopeptide repeat-containing protein [Hibiscus syriacus]